MVDKRVSVVKTQVFPYSGKGISVKLYSVLEESFVRIFRRVVVGPGVLYMGIGCWGKSEGLFESGFRGLFFARLM